MSVLDRFRLDGRVALITGGTKGLGRSMADGFVEAGAAVAVVSRHHEESTRVAEELTAHGGRRCAGYAADVTDPAQVAGLVQHVLDDFGQVDILVNNAGINLRGPIEALSVEQFDAVQAVNVRGPFADDAGSGAGMGTLRGDGQRDDSRSFCHGDEPADLESPRALPRFCRPHPAWPLGRARGNPRAGSFSGQRRFQFCDWGCHDRGWRVHGLVGGGQVASLSATPEAWWARIVCASCTT